MLKNKCCLYVIISIRFFSITICNLLIEFPSYKPREYFMRKAAKSFESKATDSTTNLSATFHTVVKKESV